MIYIVSINDQELTAHKDGYHTHVFSRTAIDGALEFGEDVYLYTNDAAMITDVLENGYEVRYVIK